MPVPMPVAAPHPNPFPPRVQVWQSHCPSGPSGDRPRYPLRLAPKPALALPPSVCLSPHLGGAHHHRSALPRYPVPCSRSCTHVPSQPCCAAPCNRRAQTQTFWDRQGPQTFHVQPTQSSIHFSTSHTFKSWTRRLPPIVPVLECLPKSVWCSALWVFSDHRPPPSSEAPEIPLRVICDISLHALSHAAFVLTTLRPADSRHPRTHHPLQIGTALPLACVCVFWPPDSGLLNLYLPSPTFASPILRCQSYTNLADPGPPTARHPHTISPHPWPSLVVVQFTTPRCTGSASKQQNQSPAELGRHKKSALELQYSFYTSRRTAQVTARLPPDQDWWHTDDGIPSLKPRANIDGDVGRHVQLIAGGCPSRWRW